MRLGPAGPRTDEHHFADVARGEIGISDANGEQVSRLGPGNSFVERGLVRDGRAATAATALLDAVLLLLPAEIFHRLVKLDATFETEHKHLFNDFGINLRKNEFPVVVYEDQLDRLFKAEAEWIAALEEKARKSPEETQQRMQEVQKFMKP